jgi:alkylhydroperoxidase/carboxymuconolactone decarboxylase family protein YurZ
MTADTSRYEQGLAIRREVLGAEHVDRSLANATNGARSDEIREVLVQADVYCGMPAALEACRTAEAALEQHQRVG